VKSRIVLIGIAVVVAGAFAWFVWPTLYRHGSDGVREHRITGDVQMRNDGKWVRVYLNPDSDD